MEKEIFVQKLNRVHTYFFEVFLFAFEKRGSWPFGVFSSHPCRVSRCIRNIFWAVTAIGSKQRFCLFFWLWIMQKRAFEVSFLLSTLQETQDGQELGPGPSGTRVWSKAGLLSTETRFCGAQAQLSGA